MILYLSISLKIVLGAQKNHLIEMVLLSTHNMCFDWKINFDYTLFSGCLKIQRCQSDWCTHIVRSVPLLSVKIINTKYKTI